MNFFAKRQFRLAPTLLLLLAGCSHGPARSVATDSYCQTGQSPIVARYAPPVPPKYFFKPAGEASEIAFVAFDSKRQADQNYLFDLATGKLTAIPGEFDPIGLFNSPILTVPQDNGKGGTSMMFYDLRELRRNGVRTQPLLKTDTSLMGRYQTLGTLKRQADGRARFRIITDGNQGGNFRDFDLDPRTIPARLTALGPTRILCPNLRDRKTGQLEQKLPMLSKDGRLVSLFDLNEQQMRIYRIDDRTGNCSRSDAPSSQRGDLGKLDFSPASDQVAFHYSDRSLNLGPLTFGMTEAHWQLRSAVYDFRQKSYRLLPFFGKNTNTFYPAFLPNGRLLILQSSGESSEFIEVDLSRVNPVSAATVDRLAALDDRAFRPYQLLSDRFVEKCFTEPVMSLRANRLLNLFSLTRAQCAMLARDTPARLEVSGEELLRACEQLAKSQ